MARQLDAPLVIPAQAAQFVIPTKAAQFVIPAQAAQFVIPAQAGIQGFPHRRPGPRPPPG